MVSYFLTMGSFFDHNPTVNPAPAGLTVATNCSLRLAPA
jgi:hypothetical protein